MKRVQYTAKDLIESAKAYKNKTTWSQSDGVKHRAAMRRGNEFYELCCRHMVKTMNVYNLPYSVYAFEFTDNCAYVGYTYDVKARYNVHTTGSSGSSVYEHTKMCKTYSFKILVADITKLEDAGRLELEWFNRYKDAGWSMLNRVKCGQLVGAAAKIYTKKQLIESASKYAEVGEWRSNNRMLYAAAKKYGKEFLASCVAHMDSRRVYLTDAEIIESARKYKTKMEWAAAEIKLYLYAARHKLTRKCCAHMPKKSCNLDYMPYKNATNEAILADARLYATRSDWYENSLKLAGEAKRRGKEFYNLCVAHMPVKSGPRTCPTTSKRISEYKAAIAATP